MSNINVEIFNQKIYNSNDINKKTKILNHKEKYNNILSLLNDLKSDLSNQLSSIEDLSNNSNDSSLSYDKHIDIIHKEIDVLIKSLYDIENHKGFEFKNDISFIDLSLFDDRSIINNTINKSTNNNENKSNDVILIENRLNKLELISKLYHNDKVDIDNSEISNIIPTLNNPTINSMNKMEKIIETYNKVEIVDLIHSISEVNKDIIKEFNNKDITKFINLFNKLYIKIQNIEKYSNYIPIISNRLNILNKNIVHNNVINIEEKLDNIVISIEEITTQLDNNNLNFKNMKKVGLYY
jgi:hypothetical protein